MHLDCDWSGLALQLQSYLQAVRVMQLDLGCLHPLPASLQALPFERKLKSIEGQILKQAAFMIEMKFRLHHSARKPITADPVAVAERLVTHRETGSETNAGLRAGVHHGA